MSIELEVKKIIEILQVTISNGLNLPWGQVGSAQPFIGQKKNQSSHIYRLNSIHYIVRIKFEKLKGNMKCVTL